MKPNASKARTIRNSLNSDVPNDKPEWAEKHSGNKRKLIQRMKAKARRAERRASNALLTDVD